MTKLPFIKSPEKLPDNYILAKKRTENLISKLRKNPDQLGNMTISSMTILKMTFQKKFHLSTKQMQFITYLN